MKKIIPTPLAVCSRQTDFKADIKSAVAQLGCVYGREQRVAAMRYYISGFTVLPRP